MHYKTTGPAFTWGHQTAPSRHQGGIVTPFPQAKVLGGGSSINAQVYIRGIPQDYDAWRNEFGCAGWSYDDVLPYFIRAEDNLSFANEHHGVDGPLKVSDQKFPTRLPMRGCEHANRPEFRSIRTSTAWSGPDAAFIRSPTGMVADQARLRHIFAG